MKKHLQEDFLRVLPGYIVPSLLFFQNKLPRNPRLNKVHAKSLSNPLDPTPSSVKGAPLAPQPDFQETETSNLVTKLYPQKKHHVQKTSASTPQLCAKLRGMTSKASPTAR